MQIDYNEFIALCTLHGKAPSTAASEAGIARNQPGKWKRGEAEASATSIRKLAKYFGVPIEMLVLGADRHNIKAENSIVLQGNQGNNTVAQGDVNASEPQLTDLERELLRIFRSLDMRKKNALMSHAYDIEDSMKGV